MNRRTYLQSTEYIGLYQQYDRMIRAKGYKTGKGSMYQGCLTEFLTWMERHGVVKVADIHCSQVQKYYDYLVNRPNRRGGTLSRSSINHHLLALRIFFDHLLDTGKLSATVLIPKNFINQRGQRAVLTREEIKLLYKYAQTPREKALLSIAYGCGLRRSEMEQLNVQDISFSKGMLIVTCGKNNKLREVPMSDSVTTDLKEYLYTERLEHIRSVNSNTSAYFLNKRGNRMSGDFLNKLLKEIVARTQNGGLNDKQVTLHCLRHSIATHLADNGAGIEFIQQFMGHAEIDASHIYIARRKRKEKYRIY